MDEIIVGIDVGTTKVCTLVGRVEDAKIMRILGVGIEPSAGIRKGIIVDLPAASEAIKRSVGKAEQTSGLEITTALVSLAGAHVSSVNSRGGSGIPGGIIDANDLARALQQAHGGGTTDLAIYVDGDVWHTMVLAVGGNHVTQDIAHGLRLPLAQAEEVKKQQGYAIRSEFGGDEYFMIRPFGEDKDVRINKQDLAIIIEARIAETFGLILQEIKRSGYDGLLPAGMVLTGGTAALPGIKNVTMDLLGMPVRTAQPENLTGLIDKLNSPAYSTSVGLLRWVLS